MRQLECDVRQQLLGREPGDHVLIRCDHARRLALVAHALAEQGGVRRQALFVQPAKNGDALVEGLPRDESGGAQPHAVLVDEAPNARVVRRREDQPPHHRLRP